MKRERIKKKWGQTTIHNLAEAPKCSDLSSTVLTALLCMCVSVLLFRGTTIEILI